MLSTKGSSLIEILLAVALSVGVVALALRGNYFTQQTLHYLEQDQQRTQEGWYALHTLSASLRQAGQFGCQQLPLYTPDTHFSEQSFSISYGVAGLAIDKWEVSAQGELSALAWRSQGVWQGETFRPEVVFLSSCLQGKMLSLPAQAIRLAHNSSHHWLLFNRGNGLSLATAEQSTGLHAPSLSLWLPFSQHYFMSGQDALRQLWLQESLSGQSAQAPVLLVEGVKSLRLRYGVRASCQPLRWKWLTQAAALSTADWQRLLRIDVELMLFSTQAMGRTIVLTSTVPRHPILSCEAESS